VKSSRRTYFKAIAVAKRTHWSDLLSSATPRSVWTAKRLAFGRPPQTFLELPGASDRAEVAETLLDHFFTSKPPPPPLLRLPPYEDYTPLTSEEVSRALSKSSKHLRPWPRLHSVLCVEVGTPHQALPSSFPPRPPPSSRISPSLPQKSA